MNLRHLQYFKVLAKYEHYTQAATKLSISQPSLSYAIAELEKELGTYLFEKQGRNICLTKYGKVFLKYVDSALNSLEVGEKKIRELTSPFHGSIDLAFIYTLGPHVIPHMIQTFSNIEEYKNIAFSFHQGTTKKIIQGLKEERFDLAFCSYIKDEPDIEFIPLIKQELVVIVPNNHPLATFEYIHLEDTAAFPFIFFNEDSGLRPVIDDLFSKAGITPKIICEVEEDNAMAGLVSVNHGIAIIPRISTLNYFDIKVLPIRSPQHDRFIYLASSKSSYLSPAVCKFKEFAKNYGRDYLLT